MLTSRIANSQLGVAASGPMRCTPPLLPIDGSYLSSAASAQLSSASIAFGLSRCDGCSSFNGVSAHHLTAGPQVSCMLRSLRANTDNLAVLKSCEVTLSRCSTGKHSTPVLIVRLQISLRNLFSDLKSRQL